MTNYKRNKGGADIRGAGIAGGGGGAAGAAKKAKYLAVIGARVVVEGYFFTTFPFG